MPVQPNISPLRHPGTGRGEVTQVADITAFCPRCGQPIVFKVRVTKVGVRAYLNDADATIEVDTAYHKCEE